MYTDISISPKYQAAAGPAEAKGRAQAGPGPARPLAWTGPAAAWYFEFTLFIFLHLGYVWISFYMCLTYCFIKD